MKNFWNDLPRPFTVLAPMDDVTDVVFREIVVDLGRPDVFFTEFTNSQGLSSDGYERVVQKLKYTEKQRPIVAQIWGNNALYMEKAAKIVKDLGFDGIDINMGCPVHEVMKKNAGAGLIGNYELSKEIIDAVKKGAEGIPVSVKTRLGKSVNIALDWASFLLEQNLSALTIHARTAKQMSKGLADWEEIGKIVEIKNKISPQTLVIGNGDINSRTQVEEMNTKYEVDGVMVGRGIFSDPWVFERYNKNHSSEDSLKALLRHIELFDKTWGNNKNFSIMKKFFKMYVKGFGGANDLRQKLMECNHKNEAVDLLKVHLNQS